MLVLFRGERTGGVVTLCCQVCERPLFPCTLEYLSWVAIKGEPHEARCKKCGGNPDNPPSLKVLRARPFPGPAEIEKEAV
jgi:hypothetical protein